MKLAPPHTDDLPRLREELRQTPWLIACLCAAWCRTCEDYRSAFDTLQTQHADKCFVWLDVEDHADLVDEVDVQNFPTILVQHEDKLLFLGTMLPDAQQLHRLIIALSANPATTPAAKSSQAPDGWSLRRVLLQSE